MWLSKGNGMQKVMSYKEWCSANNRERCQESMYAFLVYLQDNKVIP